MGFVGRTVGCGVGATVGLPAVGCGVGPPVSRNMLHAFGTVQSVHACLVEKGQLHGDGVGPAVITFSIPVASATNSTCELWPSACSFAGVTGWPCFHYLPNTQLGGRSHPAVSHMIVADFPTMVNPAEHVYVTLASAECSLTSWPLSAYVANLTAGAFPQFAEKTAVTLSIALCASLGAYLLCTPACASTVRLGTTSRHCRATGSLCRTGIRPHYPRMYGGDTQNFFGNRVRSVPKGRSPLQRHEYKHAMLVGGKSCGRATGTYTSTSASSSMQLLTHH